MLPSSSNEKKNQKINKTMDNGNLQETGKQPAEQQRQISRKAFVVN